MYLTYALATRTIQNKGLESVPHLLKLDTARNSSLRPAMAFRSYLIRVLPGVSCMVLLITRILMIRVYTYTRILF